MAARTESTTPAEAVIARAKLDPGRPAFVGSRFPPLTYAALEGQIGHVRGSLREAGFTEASRIAVAIPEPARLAALSVALSACAVAVPLDPQLGAYEIRQRLGLIEADAVALLAGQDSPTRSAARELGIAVIEIVPIGDGPEFRVETPAKIRRPKQEAADGTAFILQTSGTTGAPNLVPYSHANLLATAGRFGKWLGLTPEDRCLCIGPVYYSHGLKVTLFAPLLSGGSVAFPESPSKIDLAEWLCDLRPTWYSAGPTMHAAILEKLEARGSDRFEHGLRLVSSGGSPLSARLQKELEGRLGIPVLQHYGSSEAGQVSTNLAPPGPVKEATCGRPDPDILRVAGENGETLKQGEQGEILVRGESVFRGYINAPALNESQFVNGWFRTGDIGEIDDEGFLVIHGRLKELINRGGEKISPVEIEAALIRHPAVQEAAAFAIPHPRLGEDVAAAVVLRDNVQTTPEELRNFLSQNLAWFKIPRRIRFVDSLPRGSTGKIRRRLLSEAHNESR